MEKLKVNRTVRGTLVEIVSSVLWLLSVLFLLFSHQDKMMYIVPAVLLVMMVYSLVMAYRPYSKLVQMFNKNSESLDKQLKLVNTYRGRALEVGALSLMLSLLFAADTFKDMSEDTAKIVIVVSAVVVVTPIYLLERKNMLA